MRAVGDARSMQILAQAEADRIRTLDNGKVVVVVVFHIKEVDSFVFYCVFVVLSVVFVICF
jgi:hypothetical protein